MAEDSAAAEDGRNASRCCELYGLMRLGDDESQGRKRGRHVKQNSAMTSKRLSEVRDVCHEFVNNSEIHGVQSFYRSQGAVKKCYWIISFIVMTGGMTFSVYSMMSTYFNNPVSVSINVRQEQQLVFPAVTICNMSPVRKSALQAADLSGNSRRRKKRSASGCTCDAGWSYYNNYCYYGSDPVKLSHSDARAACQAMNAELTSVTDQSELDFLASILTGHDHWFGLYKVNPVSGDPTSYWLDGNPATFRNWKNGHPNEDDYCVEINDGEFKDETCTKDNRYTCKKLTGIL